MRADPVFAAIDIGSHSIRLLLATVENGSVVEIDRRAVITKLGRGVGSDRTLSPAAMDETLATLTEYTAISREAGAVAVATVATSAVRDAENGDFFLDRAESVMGGRPRLLSGEEEGRLSLAGVRSGRAFRSLVAASDAEAGRDVVIFDIGGGSTEIAGPAAGSDGTLSQSLQLGCVRLKESSLHSEPLSSQDIDAAHRLAVAALEPVASRYAASLRLIGVAGTVTTLVAVRDSIEPYDRARVDGSTLERKEVEGLIGRLAALTLDERGRLPGLQPRRADVVIPGAIILLALMDAFKQTSITVSESDLLDGVLLDLAGHHTEICCYRRQDPLSGRWAILAPGRGVRPHDHSADMREAAPAHVDSCPFCLGNEAMTPPEVFSLRPPELASAPDGPDWLFRVVPNLYPAMCGQASSAVTTDGSGTIPSVGAHEVFIHSPRHDLDLSTMGEHAAGVTISGLIGRVRHHYLAGLSWVTPVTNWKRDAGASLDHPHSQIFASARVHDSAAAELDRIARSVDRGDGCIQCAEIHRAKEEGRLVLDADGWIVMTPFAPRAPFECWVLPRDHRASLLGPEEEAELLLKGAVGLGRTLPAAISAAVGGAGAQAYNLLFHTVEAGPGGMSPLASASAWQGYHARIEILPRGPIFAGYELASGEVICTMPPETAAEHLRSMLE